MDCGHTGREEGVVLAPLDSGGSPARWEKIWSTRDLLLKVARLRGAGPDAEDAVQEAMARAFQHPEIEDDRLQAWLVAVTSRLCIDDHRRRAAEAARWRRASGRAVIVQQGQAVEEEVCERSEAVWVADLVTELLPPRQARALELTAAGCDVQQVASSLGVQYRAAESLLARARRTVRAAIATSVGMVVFSWRSHLPSLSSAAVPLTLASASAAAVLVITPAVPVPGVNPPVSPAPAASSPPAAMAPGHHAERPRLEYAAPEQAEQAGSAAPQQRSSRPVVPPPAPRRSPPPPLLPLPRINPPTPRLVTGEVHTQVLETAGPPVLSHMPGPTEYVTPSAPRIPHPTIVVPRRIPIPVQTAPTQTIPTQLPDDPASSPVAQALITPR